MSTSELDKDCRHGHGEQKNLGLLTNINTMPLSLFPQPLGPPIPDFNTFLIAGSYPPSAPIHLSLSQELKAPTILISPSRAALVNSLQSFDDAFLTTNYGHGRISELASKVLIL